MRGLFVTQPTPSAPLSSDKNIGKSIGNYVLLEKTGSSRWGPMYKARHQHNGRIACLKLLSAETAKSPEVLKRFTREFELTRRLNHPHVMATYEMGEDRGVRYLVMEHVGGTDLAQVVATQGPLPVQQAIDYTIQAAEGLGYLHQQGVVHRNVKPQNLVVSAAGSLRIVNLLLARLADPGAVAGFDEELTRDGQMLGTVEYLSPEQASDAKHVDARSDIYSLGCTLHFLLTGRPPYEGRSVLDKLMAHRQSPVPSLCAARPDVPDFVDRAFRKMLAKDPQERTASMEEAIAGLRGHGTRSLIERQTNLILTLAAAVALVIGVAVYLWLR